MQESETQWKKQNSTLHNDLYSHKFKFLLEFPRIRQNSPEDTRPVLINLYSYKVDTKNLKSSYGTIWFRKDAHSKTSCMYYIFVLLLLKTNLSLLSRICLCGAVVVYEFYNRNDLAPFESEQGMMLSNIYLYIYW